MNGQFVGMMKTTYFLIIKKNAFCPDDASISEWERKNKKKEYNGKIKLLMACGKGWFWNMNENVTRQISIQTSSYKPSQNYQDSSHPRRWAPEELKMETRCPPSSHEPSQPLPNASTEDIQVGKHSILASNSKG